MFKGIKRIKRLGVFGDYSQPSGTADFGVKNIIYGWNYSGKTTLSRVFSHLERGDFPLDLGGYAFGVDTDVGQVTETNAKTSGLVVRVFNSDFVHDNLNFGGSMARPILLLGAESEEAQKKIVDLAELRKRVHQATAKQENKAAADDKALADLKKKAAAVTKEVLQLTEIYTATQLERDLAVVNLGIDCKLSNEQLEADTKLVRTSEHDALPELAILDAKSMLPELWKEAGELLAQKPEMANAIEYLTQHPAIARWIETGLPFHEHKQNCEFCGNPLDPARVKVLRDHFSKDQADFKSKLESLMLRVSEQRVAFAPPSSLALNAQFRDRYAAAVDAALAASEDHDKLAARLVQELQEKISALFVSREHAALDQTAVEAWINAGASLDEIIHEHNQLASHFPEEKRNAIKRARLHYAQVLHEKESLEDRARKRARFDARARKLKAFGEAVEKQKQELEATISQSQKGREEINRRIDNLLGSDSVQIKVIELQGEERFQLVRRDGSVAKHLSEGEKTAIAFSFFLTKLQELKDFDKAIVYIDDPISSLDSNHIFQVAATIREVFFEQAGGPGGEWKTKCRQVFFSTHNFEFFGLLRELPINPKKTSNYLVKRISPDASTFENMPVSMSKYASEYHFLFSVLDEFRNATDKSDYKVLMHIPNAVRRFVELYTYSKYPDGIGGTVDQRAEKLFGIEKAKRILKVLHYFSHANNIERIATNTDLICDIEAAVDELISLIESKDPLHFEALKAAL
ncbi:AAA family ATPase [Variovorax sp. AFSI2.2]|uniref:AAA family ATPase n=1 Tax=Variovorax sp. AFSI2.2 TaxID=3384160 RepID=UPI003EBE5FD1